MNEIKRIGWHGVHGMQEDADGDYVLHSDHEAEIARLRAEVDVGEKNLAAAMDQLAESDADNARLEAEVEAYRKDAERWDWIMSNYYGGDLARTQKIIGQCWTREQMETAIDKDLSERKQAAMGASA